MIFPIIDNPKVEYIYSILLTVGGALTYVPFVRYNMEVPFLSKFYRELTFIRHNNFISINNFLDFNGEKLISFSISGKITQFLQMIFKCTPVVAMPDWPEC